MKEPTHAQGHILDLVLTHGFSISDVHIDDLSFLDHKPIMFTADISCHTTEIMRPEKWSRVGLFAPTSVEKFSVTFKENCDLLSSDYLVNVLNVDELLNTFNYLCTSVLDIIAPTNLKKYQNKIEPWLNNNTRSLRKACRRAERRWKKNKLQVSYDMLRESLMIYQKAVKVAKSQYFSEIIRKSTNS